MRRTSLSEVLSLRKPRLQGRTLFVVFIATADADIDFVQVLKEAELEPDMQSARSASGHLEPKFWAGCA